MEKNRDIEVLRRIMYTMQQVRSLEERAAWEKDRMNNVTSHLSFMPHGGGIPSGLDRAFEALSELEDRHKSEAVRYTKELKRAESILNGIESMEMRTFVMLMYVEQLPITEIRERLNMSRRNFDSARKAVEDAADMKSVMWRF